MIGFDDRRKREGAGVVERAGRGGRRRRSMGAGTGSMVLALALIVGAVGCSDSAPPAPSPGSTPGGSAPVGTAAANAGTLRMAVLDLATLDPAEVSPTIQSEMVAADLLFDGLTSIDPANNQAVPALAATITPNADASVWTFVLRDATFSDGQAVTAADVKFSFERIARKGTASLAGSGLEVIAGYQEFFDGAPELTGARIVDSKTIEITTRGPYAALPELLAAPVYGIVPKAVVDAVKTEFAAKPVGAGPFELVSQDDKAFVMRKAKGSAAAIDRVELVKFTDRAATVQAWKDGTVDWAPIPAGATVENLQEQGSVQPGAQTSERFFAINLNSPVYGEGREKFRQAIVRAVDRKKIATTILKSPVPLNGVVPPSIPGGTADPCGEPCSFDVAAAKALLAELFPDGNVPTVRIDSYTGANAEDEAQAKAAEAIVADLGAAGIPVEAAVKPFEEYRTLPLSPDRQVFSYGWVGLAPDPDVYLRPLFSGSSDDNRTGFKSPEIDMALAKAKATTDREARLTQYAEIEKQIMATMPVIPLALLPSSVLVARRVQGYAPRFDGTFATDRLRLTP